jgi:pantetheine-phosphate adenylyltransferase
MSNIIVSGTFDRLHEGHKKLLSKIIIDYMHFDIEYECNHMLVEITPNNYVQKYKKYSSMVQSERERLLGVERYLVEYIDPAYFTVVISNDEYGSSMYSNNLDIVVVGKDTEPWAKMINFYREQSGLIPLEVIVTEDYIKDGQKISSTSLREKEFIHGELGFI